MKQNSFAKSVTWLGSIFIVFRGKMSKVLLIFCVLVLLCDINFGIFMAPQRYMKTYKDILRRAGKIEDFDNFSFSEVNEQIFTDRLEPQFIREYKMYTRTGLRSRQLNKMLRLSQTNSSILKMDISDLTGKHGNAMCLGCRFALGMLLNMRKLGMNKEKFKNIAMSLCTDYIQPREVCDGAIDLNIVS